MSHQIHPHVVPASSDIRPLVLESWRRSLSFGLSPDSEPHANVQDNDLREYRQSHPLALVLPVIHQLLVRHTVSNGLIVAVGDHSGRLLWVDGDRDLRRRAESMAFIEGAHWSEEAVGTSAPGTALALGHSVQIKQTEHFNQIVHPWSCSAVPVHDRATGTLLGVIDITGGKDAVAPITLPLLEATVAAVEAELDLHRTKQDHRQNPGVISGARGDRDNQLMLGSSPRTSSNISLTGTHTPTFSILGREVGMLQIDQATIELSTRHAEILTLLAWHPSGLSAQELSRLIYGSSTGTVNVRSEMVRLRKALEEVSPALAPLSRPYRLFTPVELDAQRLLGFLDRGAHRVALACYTGPVMPSSVAPGIVSIREQVSSQLRGALLSNANVETLLAYAKKQEATYDVELWQTCLRLLPLRSPKRSSVVAHLERVEAELA